MAAKKQAAKARRAASGASPYVQRVVEDAELRDNVMVAFDSAKSAYGRLTNGKPATKVMDDKKLHKDLRQAAEALRDAGQALREGPQKPKRRGGFGKLLIVGLVGAGLAVALSEDLRNKILDLLFGAEEEFDYTSTTSPASAPASETVSS
ncbi:MAG: hypothetical protein QOI62_447 [Solirubrobacteraceae bacterium]|jgi:hypothetical protein|nr:hypothetical protein [Solirubrobacteraceae bacterium]MEA2277361.1 hypothetical protein [Solirubrobacteraceae bacterium]MEA2357187.1 hypothetical protein [Solirubrobacteraceae bacterium]MEA2393381.1 hypothetical protein [Solirubrobacteraceae bacterium]